MTRQVLVMNQEQWLAKQKEDGQCGCLNCWSRYHAYYGEPKLAPQEELDFILPPTNDPL